MEAQATIQTRINAQENYDAIVYGIKAIQAAGGENRLGNGPLLEQALTAQAVAQGILGHPVDWRALGWGLRKAKKIAAAELKGAKEAVRELGTRKQLRLALAA